MDGTKMRNTSKFMVFLVATVFLLSGAPGRFSRTAEAVDKQRENAARLPAGNSSSFSIQSASYNKLLQDDSSGDQLRFNSTTGEYLFSRCSNGFSLSGAGNVTVHGSQYSLTHYAGDRRVLASLDEALHKGNASVQVFALGVTYTITDRNTTNDPGLSDAAPPQVGITAPNGGEIIDTGSSFTISWNVTDNVGVVSQNLLLSTDAGTNWSSIASGLAGSVNQYVWAVPAMINQQTARVRVVARDAACNTSVDDSDANFTIWNPPASFTHSAEAPLFFAGQGFTSTIFMTNASANPLVVELDPHRPDGNATQKYPYQLLLNAGASATVDAASLYTIGPSAQNPDVADMIDGGIRLRHNGSQDNDVRALIVTERTCSERFTTPFTYAESSLSASGTMQCSPLYYVDYETDAFVSFQNVTNEAQTVQLTCNYGTGAPGTPNGKFKNQPMSLGPQQTVVLNLRSIWNAFGGAGWGSMDAFTTNPRSVVCHSVMMSAEDSVAWDCPFLDPAMSASTTKVAETVMLDYNSAQDAYIMICNTSETDSRTVTASFNTSNGVVLSPVQVTVAPGSQQMIELSAQQLLLPGGSTVADARLSYNGNPSDIVAAGCSMSGSGAGAAPMKFKEATAGDGRRLTSPYFRFDETTSGVLRISNLGSTTVNAGARMVFANSTAKPLKTAMVNIPAGGVGTIDLASAVDGVPDNVDSLGRVDLIHSGPAGSVTAAVTAFGCGDSGPVVPLDAGPSIDPVTIFPTGVVIIPGGCTVVDAITDGTVTDPVLTSSNPCFGTAIFTYGTGPNTYQTTLCVPITCTGDVPIEWSPGGGGGTDDESDLVVVQSNFQDFTTTFGTRLNPEGTTPFTLTGQSAFPNALLQVEFVGKGGGIVSTLTQGNGVSTSVTGTGPLNHAFLGNVKKILVTQLNPDGTPNTSVPTVLKAKHSGAYYALDRPASITGLNPNAVPVTGGTITITGSGIRTWSLTDGVQTVIVNPIVLVGKTHGHDQIPFTVISVTSDFTTLRGNVGPTPNNIATCPELGETPCKTVTVINPGGSDGVDDFTSEKLLTINAPPAPVIDGTAALSISGVPGPATSNSIAMQNIRVVGGFTAASPVSARITGRNLSRVRTVTFVGAAPVAIGPSNINGNGTKIDVGVPAFCITGQGGSNTVAVTVDDGVNPVVSFAGGWIYTSTGPIQIFIPNVITPAIAFLAGPCEDVNVNYVTVNPGGNVWTDCSLVFSACVTVSPRLDQHGAESILFPNANIAVFRPRADCSNCGHGTSNGAFPITAINARSGSQVSLCVSVSCNN